MARSLNGSIVYSHLMRAILAGGGTGGHVIPALAIPNELKKSYAAEVLFIGTARGIENRLVPAAGYPLQLVRVGALKNVSLMTRAKTAFDLPRAVWDASRMLNEFAPDVVIGVGGYASGPAMLAAVVKHIPTLAFEPNVVPGFANRVVARFVPVPRCTLRKRPNIFDMPKLRACRCGRRFSRLHRNSEERRRCLCSAEARARMRLTRP